MSACKLRVLVVIALMLAAPRASAQPMQWERAARSVVRIFAFNDVVLEKRDALPIANPVGVHGSGTIISSDGLILTAKHVVHEGRSLAVWVSGQRTAVPATLVYEDPVLDFAFVMVSGTYPDFVPLPRAQPSIHALQSLTVAGYPMESRQTRALPFHGNVAGRDDTQPHVWEAAAAFNPGISGGPVFDDAFTPMGIAIKTTNTQAGFQGVGYFLEISPILESYRRDVVASGLLARKRQEHVTGDQNAKQEVASLVASLVINNVSFGSDLVRLATRSPRPEVKLLVAAIAWNVTRSIMVQYDVDSPNKVSVLADRQRAVESLALAALLCDDLAHNHASFAAGSAFIGALSSLARANLNGGGTAQTAAKAGQVDWSAATSFDSGDSMPLPLAGFSVRIPQGRFQMASIADGTGYTADAIKSDTDELVIISFVVRAAIGCATWASSRRRVGAPRPYDAAAEEPSDSGTLATYCVNLGSTQLPQAIIVTASGSPSPATRDLIAAIGNAAIDRYGHFVSGTTPSCPDSDPRCKSDTVRSPTIDDFNPKRRLSILRGELKLLSFTGPGVNTGLGGALAFTGASNSLDSVVGTSETGKPRIADVAFAHGGRALLGYESHDSVMFDGEYGLGFLLRIWHFGLMVRAMGGLDVLDGGGKQTINGITTDVPGVFKLPFGFVLGFDARLRCWLTHAFGVELGGGFLRRVPDESTPDWVSREVLFDGHLLFGVGDDVVMSLGVEYADYQWATGVRGTLGFGF